MSILKGSIMITDNTDVIYNFPLGPMCKVITLDEDGILPENDNILTGTCLLPPINAKIAEADGNEYEYDCCYREHLLAPYQQQFIGALIAYLYKGGNILLFLPELGYTNTRDKLLLFIFQLYGIHIGIINYPDPVQGACFYDESATPIWLNFIYEIGAISAYEYLSLYPEDACLTTNNKIMNFLLSELKPYDSTLEGKINHILHLHKLLHKNPNIRMPIKTMI